VDVVAAAHRMAQLLPDLHSESTCCLWLCGYTHSASRL